MGRYDIALETIKMLMDNVISDTPWLYTTDVTAMINGSGITYNNKTDGGNILFKVELARCLLFGDDRDIANNHMLYTLRGIIRQSIDDTDVDRKDAMLQYLYKLLGKGVHND